MSGKPVTLAITGGIGSGKSMVGEQFAGFGAAVIDSDHIVHYLYENDELLRRDVITAFGPSILKHDETGIDRKKLAEKVFTCAENRERLNRIVHPKVRSEIKKRIRELSGDVNIGCIVVLVPLLIEANMAGDFDRVVLVTADENIRVDRIKKRNELTDEEIRARIHAQMPDNEKRRFAHFIIDNNGSKEQTKKQIEMIYNNVIQQSHHKPAHQVDLMEG